MKTFKSIISVALLSFLFLMPSSLFAQAPKASFAGTWAFNEAKSKLPEGGFRMTSDKLVVTQDANTLSVERTSQRGTNSEKYTLDGKECSNPAGFGTAVRKSTAVFSEDGKTLTITSTMTFGENEMKSKEVWKLTAENALSLESSMTSTRGDMNSTAVYDKK